MPTSFALCHFATAISIRISPMRSRVAAITPMRSVSCLKGCIVSKPWSDLSSSNQFLRVLINPANNSLTGPQRKAFPRGGPVPPPGEEVKSFAYDDLLYPEQTVDGQVHLQGAAALRAELAATRIIQERESGEHIRCLVGDAVLTSGTSLPFDAIVHTVPPFFPRGNSGDAAVQASRAEWARLMKNCYMASFKMAIDFASSRDQPASGLAIATPVLGSGARGAPFASAARVLAEAAVEQFGNDASADSTSLRIFVHQASLGSDLNEVEEALTAAAGAAAAAKELHG